MSLLGAIADRNKLVNSFWGLNCTLMGFIVAAFCISSQKRTSTLAVERQTNRQHIDRLPSWGGKRMSDLCRYFLYKAWSMWMPLAQYLSDPEPRTFISEFDLIQSRQQRHEMSMGTYLPTLQIDSKSDHCSLSLSLSFPPYILISSNWTETQGSKCQKLGSSIYSVRCPSRCYYYYMPRSSQLPNLKRTDFRKNRERPSFFLPTNESTFFFHDKNREVFKRVIDQGLPW